MHSISNEKVKKINIGRREENEKDDLEYDFESGYSCGKCLGWCIWRTGYDGLADK